MRALLDEVRPQVSPGYDEIFYTNLPELATHLSKQPDDRDAFVKFITLYHLVIEGALALTGQRFALEGMRELGVTHHGFYQGFTAVARDESRHVNFGVKVLQEAVHEDPKRFAPLIQQTLVESLPLIQTTLEPPDGDIEYLRMREYAVEEDEILQFAMDSLTKRLRAIGINLAA
jgi:ribonucleoside-diphosphate reductase beta chain